MSYIMIKKNNIIQRVMNEWSFQRKEEEIDRVKSYVMVCMCNNVNKVTLPRHILEGSLD